MDIHRFRNAVLRAVGLRPTPTPAWPLQDGCDIPEMMDQSQSPLFQKLSTELRILVYSFVLSDPERFLHICMNWKKKCRRLAHWRCTDMDSPFPTFQHYCFGEKRSQRRVETITDDKLIALLMSCRRVYSEALEILYARNIFHFRGGLSLPAFKRSIPAAQWNAICKIHISTAYSPFYWPNYGHSGYKTPENLPNWNQICRDLSSLPNLQTLSFDILADDPYWDPPRIGVKNPEILILILKPLKTILSKRMKVELNVEIPEEVLNLLEPVNYEIVVREMPFNEVFRKMPLLDCINLEKL